MSVKFQITLPETLSAQIKVAARRGIKKAFTFDRHYRTAGFQTL